MSKYFYRVSFGFAGTDSTGLIETDSDESTILGYLREVSIENAMSFGYEQDEDHFGDLDTVGSEWDDKEEDYLNQGQIEYLYEPYDPEEHDGQVYAVEFEQV